jgi:hypothetical protein
MNVSFFFFLFSYLPRITWSVISPFTIAIMGKFEAPSRAKHQHKGSSTKSTTESVTPPSDMSKQSGTNETESEREAPAHKRTRVTVEEIPDKDWPGSDIDEMAEEELSKFIRDCTEMSELITTIA